MTNNNDLDPRELLRRCDPLRDLELPDVHSVLATEMRDRILANPRVQQIEPTRIRPQVSKRRLVVAAVAALILGAATWALTRSPSNLSGIACYEDTDLSGSLAFASSESGLTPSACADAWASAELKNPQVVPGTVPELLACVSDDGILRVFPSSDLRVCARLGLADYEPPSDQQEGELQTGSDLRDELALIFIDDLCLPFAETLQRVELLMDSYPDWTLIVRGTESDQFPCASYGIDFETRNVIFIPLPPG